MKICKTKRMHQQVDAEVGHGEQVAGLMGAGWEARTAGWRGWRVTVGRDRSDFGSERATNPPWRDALTQHWAASFRLSYQCPR